MAAVGLPPLPILLGFSPISLLFRVLFQLNCPFSQNFFTQNATEIPAQNTQGERSGNGPMGILGIRTWDQYLIIPCRTFNIPLPIPKIFFLSFSFLSLFLLATHFSSSPSIWPFFPLFSFQSNWPITLMTTGPIYTFGGLSSAIPHFICDSLAKEALISPPPLHPLPPRFFPSPPPLRLLSSLLCSKFNFCLF